MPARHIILDTGSCSTRAGFAGDQAPSVVCPTLVGHADDETTYVGAAAQSRSKSLAKLSPVLTDGVLSDWEAVEQLWNDVLTQQLKVRPEEHNIMLLDSPLPDVKARQKMAELMFETFQVPALFLANQAVLTLYSAGRVEGVVLQTGDGAIHAVPIKDGFAVPTAVTKMAFGGNESTQYLGKLLEERGINLLAEPHTLREIKDKMCYVAADYKQEMAKASSANFEQTFKLPDGKDVSLGSEMFKCPELLFQPSTAGRSASGVAAILNDAISRCESAKQPTMYGNIVIGGGPSMCPGFSERLSKEMDVLVPGQCQVVDTPVSHRGISAWAGGSILACLGDFASMWVTTEQYKESGVAIVHEKCK